MMKIEYLIRHLASLILLGPLMVFSQEKAMNANRIDNDSIKFEIIMVSSNLLALPPSPRQYLVYIEFSDEQLRELASFKPNYWYKLLEDTKTDWATNLILYSLHQKDAFLIKENDQFEWRLLEKRSDIGYWKSYLRNH